MLNAEGMEKGPLLFAWHWGALAGQWLGAGQKIAELGWLVPSWSSRGSKAGSGTAWPHQNLNSVWPKKDNGTGARGQALPLVRLR